MPSPLLGPAIISLVRLNFAEFDVPDPPKCPMAPGFPDLQLTRVSRGDGNILPGGDAGDLEDVRLLDSYEDNSDRLEEGMKRVQVRVTGMTCAACSNSVEGTLRSLNGVLRASVALLQNKADVVFDPSLVKANLDSPSPLVALFFSHGLSAVVHSIMLFIARGIALIGLTVRRVFTIQLQIIS